MYQKSAYKLLQNKKDNTAYEKIKVQTFFREKALQQYFVVYNKENSELSILGEVAKVVQAQLGRQKETKKIEEEKAQVIEAEVVKTNKTSQFKRTGQLEHLENQN